MNLFNNPSLTELSHLISSIASYHDHYHVMVDYDGEVLIAPSFSPAAVPLHKYKFYLTGLTGKANIGIIAARNFRYLNQLYKNLLYCWENALKGSIDFEEITNVQTINYWLESRNISAISRNTSAAFLSKLQLHGEHEN